ncbi:MAG: hypothetical protein A2298_03615 [Gammaproteobacteria bacterium RIFOXYB2_FULL_38_6]|nr:MAG: hypothetical protein A2298_03615 [Gammaproteobacteria bacterium RIFOXYB2_FULL_38_6]
MNSESSLSLLESQIRDCFGRVVWTHKIQEKCSDILHRRNSNLKILQIILSACTTSGILVSVFGDNYLIGIISAIISAILLALNTFIKNYDLGEMAQKHSDCASHLWNIREKYLSLLTDIKSGAIEEREIRTQRDLLQKELFNIYKGSPRSISKAYDQAAEALNARKEVTLKDDEINSYLPEELHKKG